MKQSGLSGLRKVESKMEKIYRYDKENHRLENVSGNDSTTQEIENFINGEFGELKAENERLKKRVKKLLLTAKKWKDKCQK